MSLPFFCTFKNTLQRHLWPLMNKLGLLIRYVVFCMFFGAGTAAMVLSFLVRSEVTDYFQSRAMLEKSNRDNQKIRDMIDQYKSQISLIERDPNILIRLQQITLGQAPAQEDTVYPVEYNPQLAALARKVIEESNPADANEQLPVWVIRSMQPRYRTAMLLSGAGLILLAFMTFNGPRTVKPKQKSFYAR